MDPRTVAISNLRILNDYLNHTIGAMVPRVGLGQFGTTGLSHTPFGAISPFGASPLGVDPTLGQVSPYVGGAFSPFGVTGSIAPSYSPVIDPFLVHRGLSHTQFGGGFGAGFGAGWGAAPWMPIAELVRQQHLLGQFRPWGVPVI